MFVAISIQIIFSSSANAMSVSPAMFDVEVDPGASVTKEIILKNDTNQATVYRMYSENFISHGEDGGQTYLSDSSNQDLASWFSWKQERIVVNVGERIHVPIEIRIPSSATPGGHYATVFFSQEEINHQGSSVGISGQVGVLFLVRVSGEVTQRASIDSFMLRLKEKGLHCLPASFDLRIRNEGSSHIRPMGYLIITNVLGILVKKIPFNETNKAILPNSIRHFEMKWMDEADDIEPEGFWDELKMEWKHFSFGRYTAEVQMTYGPNDTAVSSEKIIFWICPWRLMLFIFGCCISLLVVVKIYNRCLINCLIARSDAKHKTKR
jgi:hypothetical protein